MAIYAFACKLSRGDPRRRENITAPALFFTDTPMPLCSYTTREVHSSSQSPLGMKWSHLAPISGRPIKDNSSCPTTRVESARMAALQKTAKVVNNSRHQSAPRPPREPDFRWLRKSWAASAAARAPARGFSPSSPTDYPGLTATALPMPGCN